MIFDSYSLLSELFKKPYQSNPCKSACRVVSGNCWRRQVSYLIPSIV